MGVSESEVYNQVVSIRNTNSVLFLGENENIYIKALREVIHLLQANSCILYKAIYKVHSMPSSSYTSINCINTQSS